MHKYEDQIISIENQKERFKKDFSGQGWVELEEGIVGIDSDGEI